MNQKKTKAKVKATSQACAKRGGKRKPVLSLTSQQWEEIGKRYISGTQTLEEIAAEFGITRHRITRHAKQRGWLRDEDGRRLNEARRDEVHAHVQLAVRLVKVFERQIKKTEEYLDAVNEDEPSLSVAERERDARTLASLARTLRQLEDLRRLPDLAVDAKDPLKEQDSHGDDMRAQLQRRLDQLAKADDQNQISSESDN